MHPLHAPNPTARAQHISQHSKRPFQKLLRFNNTNGAAYLLWHRIKALLLRLDSDWCGPVAALLRPPAAAAVVFYCGGRNRKGAIKKYFVLFFYCGLFYCGNHLRIWLGAIVAAVFYCGIKTFILYSKFLQFSD